MSHLRQTKIVGQGQPIRRGDVRAVRELREGVQAEVCLGASAEHGSAVVRVTTKSAAVQEAMTALKDAIRAEALALCQTIVAEHEDQVAS